MKRPMTMAGIFRLLERINMNFPKGRISPSDKLQFLEDVNYLVKSSNGKVRKGK